MIERPTKDVAIKVRLTAEHLNALMSKATAEGVTVSEVVRWSIDHFLTAEEGTGVAELPPGGKIVVQRSPDGRVRLRYNRKGGFRVRREQVVGKRRVKG